jgi:hypothetical protein
MPVRSPPNDRIPRPVALSRAQTKNRRSAGSLLNATSLNLGGKQPPAVPIPITEGVASTAVSPFY